MSNSWGKFDGASMVSALPALTGPLRPVDPAPHLRRLSRYNGPSSTRDGQFEARRPPGDGNSAGWLFCDERQALLQGAKPRAS